jgi:tRNA modification GTPase
MYPTDTIVAPATPPGRGAVAVIRLSGPRAIAIAHALWHPLAANPAPRELRLGEIRDPDTGATLDRAMCAIFPAPRSLTGEDVAEIHCHGGVYLVRRILALAADVGARIAEPGEFTRRAYLNGRIDLTAAEAIADLVEARGEAGLTQAIAQLGGALAGRVAGLRECVIAIRAHLEAEIDFSDEDLSLPSRAAIATDIEALAADIRLLRDSFVRGRLTREGARAAIIGKPNVGKSSILNLLLGADRAIVTPIPGTTRDVIEDSISLGPGPLVLADTAGIREGRDEVERLGIARTRISGAAADLLIAVFDSSRAFDSDDGDVIAATRERPGVALINKRDLPQVLYGEELRRQGLTLPILDFSATTAIGLDHLRDELIRTIEALAGGGTPVTTIAISRERHRAALAEAGEALEAAHAAAVASMPPEIVAVDIALATEALGSITGTISSEDILDAIFREFCIGK